MESVPWPSRAMLQLGHNIHKKSLFHLVHTVPEDDFAKKLGLPLLAGTLACNTRSTALSATSCALQGHGINAA